jgi:UDPglucose--hexose-1-phosphate uridylyltransferase
MVHFERCHFLIDTSVPVRKVATRMQEMFQKRLEKALFRYPGSGIPKSCTVEYRIDPLTGRSSVICENLLQKISILYGETDAGFIKLLVEETRPNCIFCPPGVFESTPLYTTDLCPNGRLQNATSVLFPNLFPTAALHAVLTWPDYHFLTPGQFDTTLLADAFSLTETFAGSVNTVLPEVNFLSVNCNYMPPAGGSIIHPHLQIIGSLEPPHRLAEIILAVEKWHAACRENFWDRLCAEEQSIGERWIGTTGPWTWIAPWSPMGANEIMGIHRSASTVFDLAAGDWSYLAEGLHRVLYHYENLSYSSFNFCLAGGCRNGGNAQRCVIRIISRQNVRPNYRNDEYFLQKFHGIELIVQAPETLAADLRKRFER